MKKLNKQQFVIDLQDLLLKHDAELHVSNNKSIFIRNAESAEDSLNFGLSSVTPDDLDEFL